GRASADGGEPGATEAGDEGGADADEGRSEREHHAVLERGDDGGTAHDDDEAGGGDRGEGRADAERAGEREADRAEHFAEADEAHEARREGRVVGQVAGRGDELAGAGEQEERGEGDLQAPGRPGAARARDRHAATGAGDGREGGDGHGVCPFSRTASTR